MVKVIGVRFRTAGKIYFFDPLNFEIKKGDHVIVETARGIEYGTVMSDPRMVEDDKVVQPLKPVIRVATSRDTEQEESNRQKEKEAFKVCLEKIHAHNLDMKLIDAEYTFDNNKVLFYFTADGRIDFRELVKDLASVFKTRIELRQIGVRDETKMLGGIGICGREMCCCTFLNHFAPVTLRMARDQGVALNPSKLNGACGRLMCCLQFEKEVYEDSIKRLPKVGKRVRTPLGIGIVSDVELVSEVISVKFTNEESTEIQKYKWEEIEKLNPDIGEKPCDKCPAKNQGSNGPAASRENDFVDKNNDQ